MSKNEHGIRVTSAFHNFRVGQIIVTNTLFAETLVKSGRAEWVLPEKPAGKSKKDLVDGDTNEAA